MFLFGENSERFDWLTCNQKYTGCCPDRSLLIHWCQALGWGQSVLDLTKYC